ncbi:site-2 protease family protein [candidate division KSB1 bacterium]|nr:site-2 protease family protein [candidate division KSB1 bacterium]
MKWSFKIAEVFGISIKVHAIFLLLLAYIGWANAAMGGLRAGIEAVIFFSVIFFFVLLHELGHSLVAMRYGVKVIDIVLLPIGGVARMENLPTKPLQEILVALAGPAVNFAFVIAILLINVAVGRPLAFPDFQLSGQDFWNSILSLNFFMGTFNLLPAFPMDGGRVLRGVLATRMSYARATHVASSVGQALAVLMGLAGVFYFHSFWIAIIAAFIFMGAGTEDQMVHLREAIASLTVTQVMSRRVCALQPNDPLRTALELSYQGCQDDFPVLEEGRLVGILPKQRVLTAMQEGGVEAPVRTFMLTRFSAVGPYASLARVYEEMAAQNLSAVPVIENGRILGMLTLENIGRYVLVAASLEGKKS